MNFWTLVKVVGGIVFVIACGVVYLLASNSMTSSYTTEPSSTMQKKYNF